MDVTLLKDYVAHMDVLKWKTWHTRAPLSLDKFSTCKCKEIFHFSKVELCQLTAAFKLPMNCRTRAPGHAFTGMYFKLLYFN